MAKMIILGSSNAVAAAGAENAHMVVVGETRTVLIDSPCNPILRLAELGIGLEQVTDLLVTHFHPDHVSGIPLYLMDMWLRGRKTPLDIYGLPHAIDRLENLMDAFLWTNWPNFFPVTFHRLPSDEFFPVIACDDFKLYTSEVRHMIPTVGVRVEFVKANKVVTYSCDTSPCDEVVRLGADVDLLIHEASGAFFGHSSSRQAAEIALKAGAKELCLIHYPTGEYWQESTLTDAEDVFDGKVFLAKDRMTLDF